MFRQDQIHSLTKEALKYFYRTELVEVGLLRTIKNDEHFSERLRPRSLYN
jgi:hypothetical protein